MAASMSEINAALTKRERCQLDPNRGSFVGGFGGRRAWASSEQVFFGCDKKM
jgi:hypothetical protein